MFSPQGSYLPSPPAYHDSLPSSSPRSPRGPLPRLSLAGTGTGASTPRTPEDMPNALDLEGDDGSPLLPAPAQMAREQGREERVEFEYRPIFIPRTDMSGLGEASVPGQMGGLGSGGAVGYGTRDTRGGSLLRPYISRDENGAVREKEAEQGREGRKVSPWIIVPVWLALGSAVILLNKYIFNTLNFPYPVFLTAFHMLVATVGTQILRYTTPLLDATKTSPISRSEWYRAILPLGTLFSLSLVLSNIAYVHLSVSFVQMLKAFIPVMVHVISTIVGVATLDRRIAFVLSTVTGGCVIAAAGEVKASAFGLVCMVLAVTVESARLVVLQVVLKHRRMNPLLSIYYYAPLCTLLLLFAVPALEGSAPFKAIPNVGYPMLIGSGLVAFALNVAGVSVIDSAGSLTLTLCGVLKDIGLISCSVAIFGSSVTTTQIVGYGIALAGLITFNRLKARQAKHEASVHIGEAIKGHPRVLRKKLLHGSLGKRTVALFMAVIGLLELCRSTGFSALPMHMPISTEAISSYLHHWHPSARLAVQQVSFDHLIHPTLVRPPSAGPKFSQFHAKGTSDQLIPAFSPVPDPKTLPRLAWVVVIHPNEIDKYAEFLTSTACYCMRKGIAFYVDYRTIASNHHFFHSRHVNVAKYLRYHQWVMATDADIWVGNSHIDLHRHIDLADRDGIDIVFPDRENGEVCAGAYLVKNSPGGWSFLQRWLAWSEGRDHIANWDNGDLVEMVESGQRPGAPNNADCTGRMSEAQLAKANLTQEDRDCLNGPGWARYTDTFLPCIRNKLDVPRSADKSKRWWDLDLWNWCDVIPATRMRIYKIYGGFCRNAPTTSHAELSGFKGVMEEDFLYHGQKNDTLPDPDMVLCTGKDWKYGQPASRQEIKSYFHWEYPYAGIWHGCVDKAGKYMCHPDKGDWREDHLQEGY